MRLTKVYVRFYKSFNYDYERKFARSSKPEPWENIGDTWYPYVRMGLDPTITTIVGANESGKSHLLDAIHKVITGDELRLSDFCRYSHFFSVEQGKRRTPDFGGEFEVIDQNDIQHVKRVLRIDLAVGERFHLFRPDGGGPVIYQSDEEKPTKLSGKQLEDLQGVLPSVFRLNSGTPLPASIPLHKLAPDMESRYGTRRSRGALLDNLFRLDQSNPQAFSEAAWSIVTSPYGESSRNTSEGNVSAQYQLGRSLLFDVAKIDQTVFRDLTDAIANEQEGYVNGVIQKINDALARALNFPRWWAQDREFRLMVSPREHEIVFTIRDRTGTDYSFAERSNGLKYFLSYYVQLLAHQSPTTGQSEILLMDEPDAYLSSQGQQDLLRILEEFALPEQRNRQDQVVYVTHSPFLINRNAGERIRVLDKGAAEEGTRVVKDVARNHYEPLRSSLGAFVAETSFIGGMNLFVEGLADQVLLAGISSYLRATGTPSIDSLDLNMVTIVPSGSASSIPYLVYLARGRDEVRPPCVVLLDSDSAGNEARKVLARGGARRKQILPPDLIVQVGEWANGRDDLFIAPDVRVAELEDLLSLPVAAAAANSYAVKVLGLPDKLTKALDRDDLVAKLIENSGSLFDAVKAAFTECFGAEAHIEKVGFAKEVVSLLNTTYSRTSELLPEVTEVRQNFEKLLADLAKLLRKASKQEEDDRLNNRLSRTIEAFLADHSTPTTRQYGRLLVDDIVDSLDDSDVGDRVRLEAEKLRRDFRLDEDLTKPIEQFDEFCNRVKSFRYLERLAYQDTAAIQPNETAPAKQGEG